MAFNLKASVLRILRYYKNIDIRFRRNPLYEYFSFYTFNLIRGLLGLRGINYQKIVVHHYIRNIDFLCVDKGSIFFDSFWGQKISGDPFAIYKELSSRKWNGRIYWVVRPGVHIPADLGKDDNVVLVRYNTKKYAEALLKSEFLVFNMNLPYYFVKRNEQILINTWHGVPIKKLGLNINQPVSLSANTQRCFNISDCLTVASNYEYEKVVRACGSGKLSNPSVCLGSPRIDLMLNANRENVRTSLGLPSDKKVVLFAPTWRGSTVSVSSQVADQISAIERLERELGSDYYILVSLHHFTMDALKSKKLKVNTLPKDIDINEALQGIDILVSDYSSVLIDFLLLNRPVVLYVPDIEEYSVERGLYVDLKSLPCAIARTEEELVSSVVGGVLPSDFSSYNDCMRLFLPNEDGFASKRVVDRMVSMEFDNSFEGEGEVFGSNIFIFPGALRDNGITSSLRSLIENLIGSEFSVYILVDSRHQRLVSSFYKHFSYLSECCEIIIVDRAFPKFDGVASAYRKYLRDPFSLAQNEAEAVDRAIKNEVFRIFGTAKFKAAIDFSGYDQYWSLIISGVNAEKKLIYLHSDMKAEADNPKKKHRYLRNIFSRYHMYDYVVSVSDAMKKVNESGLSRFVDRSRSVSVPNCLDLKGMIEKSRLPVGFVVPEMAALESEVVKFVCLSRLSPEKNIKVAIDSFDKVSRVTNAVLIIVGSGVSFNELREYSRSKASSSRIKFVGHLENPYPVLKNADCLLFPSSYEGQGLALLEAITLGTFCIASDIPAARDVLDGTGCYIVHADVDAFSNAMIDFIDTRPKSIRFDPKAYNRNALNRFKALVG